MVDRTPAYIHPTAFVESGAHIGDGAKVWHQAHVRTGAEIGADCVLGKNVYVDEGVQIGAGCHIQNNVSVYSGVTLAERVFVGPSAVFTNDLTPRAGSEDWKITPTFVARGASIGANATIVCGVTIAESATIAAGAVVTHDVAPNQLVAGVPARPIGWVCEAGHVLSRDPDSRPVNPCPDCGWTLPEAPDERS